MADGQQALARLRAAHHDETPYALVILDMQMPDMDGLALARAIKADAALAPVRLILLSSWGQRGDGAIAREACIDAYLTKPVRQSQLYDAIVTVMGTASEPQSTGLVTRHSLGEARAEGKRRVLLAEDSIANQKLAVLMLERLDCRVDAVANGREALEALTHMTYDLVFMDCHMPEMDGYEATTAIRHREARSGRHVPIIAMTANALPGDRERCLQAGMDDYMSKPIEAESLQVMLQAWAQPTPSNAAAAAVASSLATPAARSTLSTLDARTFKGLQELGDEEDPTFLPRLIKSFLQDAAQHITTIQVALERHDTTALRTGDAWSRLQ